MTEPIASSLDVSAVETRAELHELLGESLGFPSDYGGNWDAFWDCIRSTEQSTMPPLLRISGWTNLHRRMPRDARALRQCLNDLKAERDDVKIEWGA
ncbi:MAG: barstar family protein [Planctomycetota bacterium]